MSRYRTVVDSVRFSLPRSNAALGVLVGDLLGITALVSLGLMRHNTPGLFQSPTYAASRIVPFLLGWVLVAPAFGLFGTDIIRDYRHTLVRTCLAWTGGAVLGSILRDVATSGGAAPVFVAVMVGFGLLVLAPWRVATVALLGNRTV